MAVAVGHGGGSGAWQDAWRWQWGTAVVMFAREFSEAVTGDGNLAAACPTAAERAPRGRQAVWMDWLLSACPQAGSKAAQLLASRGTDPSRPLCMCPQAGGSSRRVNHHRA